jgi:site-specific recombinase XerC
MTQSAIDLNTIRETLRHASISTTLTYARLGADQARDAMEAHGRRIMYVASGPRLVESSGEMQ